MPWKDNSLTTASGQYVASWRVATEPLVLSRSCGERNWKEKEAQEKDQRRTQNRSSLSSSSRTQTRLWISCSQWSQCSTVSNILKCHQMGGLKTAGARTQQNGCIGTVCGILKGGPLRSKTCHVQKRWFWISKIHRWLSQVTDCRSLSAQSSNSRSANCGNFFKPPQNTGGADVRQSVVDLTSKITWVIKFHSTSKRIPDAPRLVCPLKYGWCRWI